MGLSSFNRAREKAKEKDKVVLEEPKKDKAKTKEK